MTTTPQETTTEALPTSAEGAALGGGEVLMLAIAMLASVGLFWWGWEHRNQEDAGTAYTAMAAGFVFGVATLVVLWFLATRST